MLDLAPSLVATLSAADWDAAKVDPHGWTHAMHPWPAKFTPTIPRLAIELLTRPGDIVLDPFCGCGTVAVEALTLGRNFIVSDINPLAVLVSRGKCEVPDALGRERLVAWARSLIVVDSGDELQLPFIPNRKYWFDDAVCFQLAYLLKRISTLGEHAPFLETIFSSIILRVSRQESETRYRRIERSVTAVDVLREFRRRLALALASAARLDGFRTPIAPRYLEADARDLSRHLSRGVADAAIFSPPYPNAFDYHLYHRFRMFWLGFDPRVTKHDEIGAHLGSGGTDGAWQAEMAAALREIAHCVRPGGPILCVVGDGLLRGAVVPSGDVIWAEAGKMGLERVWRGTRSIASHRRSFNLADTRLREEHLLVMRT